MTDAYTVLRVTPSSEVPLFEGHVRRLGEASRGALRHFASLAAPGIYRVTWDGRQLSTTLRPGSRLSERMPSRFAVSPFAGQRGRFPKPAPPSPYDAVRRDGVATLLTDARGLELYESCSAALVAWDGRTLVLPPEEAPAVASLAEARLAELLPHRRAPILVAEHWPLLLLNAAVGSCAVQVPGRAAFPAEARTDVDQALG